jgi:hypothetical protein
MDILSSPISLTPLLTTAVSNPPWTFENGVSYTWIGIPWNAQNGAIRLEDGGGFEVFASGGSGGGGGGQNSILSGFSIQAAGSSIPNLEPLLFLSWQASHQTRPLTSSVSTGTNYLISSARSLSYGIQKSFITGTRVTVDLSQQSLAQNAPANLYNPSFSGNAEISISQPLLQGFGMATNRRAITISKNNLTVADLNFKTQVIATVKNVIDLYWDLVSLHDNLKAKQRALDIAQKLYDDNRKRLAIGSVAPIDIVQAEAGLQTSQLDLRQARAQALQQELILKSALSRTGVDNLTIMDAHIIPTDGIQVPETEAIQPMQDMVAEALANRPSIRVLELGAGRSSIAGRLGPRRDRVHFTAQDVEKLWQFIHTGIPEEPAYAGYARIIFNFEEHGQGGILVLIQVGIFIPALVRSMKHGSEFIEIEYAVSFTGSF